MLTLEELFDAVKTHRMSEREFELYVENAEYNYWINEYCEF